LRLNNVSPQSFEKQMGYLKNNGYTVIPLNELIEGFRAGRKFAHKTVVITLDDGYADNYTNAFPVLKKYHFPATIFLISDYVRPGSVFLNWEQVKEMSRNGISFGSHTRRHAYLPNLSKAQLIDEIAGSKRDIEKNLGISVDYLAYPCGGFSDQVKTMAAQAGYKAALATNRGQNRFNLDPYELHRVHINNLDNDVVLNGKLSGYYNLFRELKSSH
jgi:peptidoglycan/xylan/chitin deacetylase (PgdA/CDA1 family)